MNLFFLSNSMFAANRFNEEDGHLCKLGIAKTTEVSEMQPEKSRCIAAAFGAVVNITTDTEDTHPMF